MDDKELKERLAYHDRLPTNDPTLRLQGSKSPLSNFDNDQCAPDFPLAEFLEGSHDLGDYDPAWQR
jgi:hypothetical protein